LLALGPATVIPPLFAATFLPALALGDVVRRRPANLHRPDRRHLGIGEHLRQEQEAGEGRHGETDRELHEISFKDRRESRMSAT
jgi:hypothetical protein